VAALGAALLPRLLADAPLAYPPLFVAVGAVVFAVVPGLTPLAVEDHVDVVERVTEFGVIVSLMGAGLKIDRPIGWRLWGTTWRLLAITMPLSIAATALLGWWVLGLVPATALLLGAVLAPTDPVLASDVQVAPPGRSARRHEVRFGLTSEAGLNDALAFPFTNAALAAIGAGGAWVGATGGFGAAWVGEWLLVDVVAKLAVGVVGGLLVGRAFAALAFRGAATTRLSEHSEGFVAVAATLIAYAATELAGGYGFLAVFIAAVSLRRYERDHEYHEVLHDFAEQVERLAAVVVLLGLGAALARGLLAPVTPAAVGVALAVLLVVRPATGYVALLGTDIGRRQRAALAFFGIRGIGSMYYLAHALAEAEVPQSRELLAVAVLVIVLSLVLHGTTATPLMRRVDEDVRRQAEPVPGVDAA
jgi:sodium/hydrogen antiporter